MRRTAPPPPPLPLAESGVSAPSRPQRRPSRSPATPPNLWARRSRYPKAASCRQNSVAMATGPGVGRGPQPKVGPVTSHRGKSDPVGLRGGPTPPLNPRSGARSSPEIAGRSSGKWAAMGSSLGPPIPTVPERSMRSCSILPHPGPRQRPKLGLYQTSGLRRASRSK